MYANIRETTHISVISGFYDPRTAVIHYYKVDKDGNWKIYTLDSDGEYSNWAPLAAKPTKCLPITAFPREFLSWLG